jgi:hypothetical protein
MTPLLESPVQQFCDANGEPYAGGLLSTYVQGTTTPKATWSDPGGTSLNTNPIVLDSAGRALIYGDGLYRLVLQDAVGNLIWDQPASTIVSAAMAPVVSAPTIADAVALLGIQSMIDASVAIERARAEAAEAALQSAITNISLTPGPPGPAGPAGATGPQGPSGATGLVVTVRTGSGMSDGNGNISVSWTPAFPTAVIQFTCHGPLGQYFSPLLYNTTSGSFSGNGVITTTSATGALAQDTWDSSGQSVTVPVPSTSFTWFAMGY